MTAPTSGVAEAPQPVDAPPPELAATRRRVAASVRAEVARQNVLQSTLAARLGLSQRAVSRRVLGQVDFTAAELAHLAIVLAVPVADLFGEEPTG